MPAPHRKVRATPLLVAGVATCVSLAAQAEPVRIDLTGEVAASTLFTLVPGDPMWLSIYVDSDAADENGSSGVFSATDPGSFEFQFKDFTPGGGEVLAISADAGSGDWNADLHTDIPSGNHPVTISLLGLGMTPDQVLPDYTAFTSGTAFFDGSLAPFAFTIDVTVLDVDIVPLTAPPTPVPAAGPGLRTLLWLLLVALAPAARLHSGSRYSLAPRPKHAAP